MSCYLHEYKDLTDCSNKNPQGGLPIKSDGDQNVGPCP